MGIAIMSLSLSNLILAILVSHFYMKCVDYRRRKESYKTLQLTFAKDLERVTAERDELLRQKKALTSDPQTAHPTVKRFSGAAVRREVEKMNAKWASTVPAPNSEILKEGSNG